MVFSEDEIEERALVIFERERPNDIWALQALPRKIGEDLVASVSFEVREKYREKARLELEAESDV